MLIGYLTISNEVSSGAKEVLTVGRKPLLTFIESEKLNIKFYEIIHGQKYIYITIWKLWWSIKLSRVGRAPEVKNNLNGVEMTI